MIYSKSGISADTEIKNISSLCQNPKDVAIVTYDNDIKRHVKKCGCPIIEPKVMYKEIMEVLNEDKKSNLTSLIVNGTAHLKPMQNTGKIFSKDFLRKSRNRKKLICL